MQKKRRKRSDSASELERIAAETERLRKAVYEAAVNDPKPTLVNQYIRLTEMRLKLTGHDAALLLQPEQRARRRRLLERLVATIGDALIRAGVTNAAQIAAHGDEINRIISAHFPALLDLAAPEEDETHDENQSHHPHEHQAPHAHEDTAPPTE